RCDPHGPVPEQRRARIACRVGRLGHHRGLRTDRGGVGVHQVPDVGRGRLVLREGRRDHCAGTSLRRHLRCLPGGSAGGGPLPGRRAGDGDAGSVPGAGPRDPGHRGGRVAADHHRIRGAEGAAESDLRQDRTAAVTAADTTALQAPTVAQRTRGRRKDLRRNWLGPLFLSPAALLFVLFIGGPFVVAIVLSLYSWDLLTPPEFVGLENFSTLFQDPVLVQAFLNTFLFAFASVVTHVVGGLLLALGVNAIANRFVSYLVRTAVFFPFIISWAAVALLWQY